MELIEQVINRHNMMRALQQVRQNKGSAGVDRMPVSELYDHLTKNRESIGQSLLNGTYLPQPILGVEIPKGNGKTRLLGVPTVVDRMLQQAVGQVLANRFEMEFEDYSRSEERRVGKECRSRWSADHEKKKKVEKEQSR